MRHFQDMFTYLIHSLRFFIAEMTKKMKITSGHKRTKQTVKPLCNLDTF
jgi:hypothetical protein